MRRGVRRTKRTPAERLLLALAAGEHQADAMRRAGPEQHDVALAQLLARDLVAARADGAPEITAAGRAHLARLAAKNGGALDPFLAQHLAPAYRKTQHPHGCVQAVVDEAESPLAWLARRKGRDRQPLIAASQFIAGERLRTDFTRAQLTPRVTTDWSASALQKRVGGGTPTASFSDAVGDARLRVRHALKAVGPEFADVLLDVCCFLKRLEDVERERAWPARSAKIVLQLGLDRLARHYGLDGEARGPARGRLRTWRGDDTAFAIEDS